ncbi:MAG: DUF72 domain-containing protein [Anaerolineae bacterium]|nr:DUF72 domain-containing protein [Anaerolineae bacterium]
MTTKGKKPVKQTPASNAKASPVKNSAHKAKKREQPPVPETAVTPVEEAAPASRQPRGKQTAKAPTPAKSTKREKPTKTSPTLETPSPEASVPEVQAVVVPAPDVTPVQDAPPAESTGKGKKREKPTAESNVTSADGAITSDRFRIGCAIWAYDGWADGFFPKGTPKDKRLNAYAQRLTAVEINSTFYAVPAVPIIKRWAEEVPDDFRFCPKFPKAISHTAQLVNVDAQTATFIGTMRVLGSKLGPLMLQLPPSFGPLRLPILQKYLQSLPTDLEIAVEVRHPDWFTEANAAKLDTVLAEVKAARVVFDVRPAHESPDPNSAQEKKPDVPLVAVATQAYVVVRYIASPVPAENKPYIDEWIPRLADWLNEGRRVYFFVHCPVEERSPEFAREIYQRLSKAVALPALPWDAIEAPPVYTQPAIVSLPEAAPEPTEPAQEDVLDLAQPIVEAAIEPTPESAPPRKPKKVTRKPSKAADEAEKAPSDEADQADKPDKPVQLTLF